MDVVPKIDNLEMDNITEFYIIPLTESKYIMPKSVHYMQNGKKKVWDCIAEHSDVSILLFNTSRNVFIFVKQFRPAVYLNNVKAREVEWRETVDTDIFPGSLGITLELCAGLIDKPNQTLEEVALAEVLEECGYDIAGEDLHKITRCRNGSGITASEVTIYYAEVTDDQKVGRGGGLAEEGELIEVAEVTVDQARDLICDESVNREAGLLFALQWFFDRVWPLKRKDLI
ncbi:Nudix hydrolase 14, chloroplastic [Bulinus truncatus]|nr:Nudix hydrolase 14, chloroplastic [Bulinus truncatus]